MIKPTPCIAVYTIGVLRPEFIPLGLCTVREDIYSAWI